MPVKKQNKKLKNRVKLKTDEQKNATKQDVRRLGVMVEAMDKHICLVAEQYGDIKKDVGSIRGDVDGIREDVGSIKEEIGEMRQTLDSHTEMIGLLMVDVSVVKDDVDILKKDMTEVKGLLKQKVDRVEVTILNQRVLALEKN